MTRQPAILRDAKAFADVLAVLTEPVLELEAWLQLVAQATLPLLGDASGAGVQLYRHAEDFTPLLWVNGAAGAFREAARFYAGMPPIEGDVLQTLYYPRTSAVTMSSVLKRFPSAGDFFHPLGVRDACGFIGHPSEREVVTLFCGLPRAHLLTVHEHARARVIARFLEAAIEGASVRAGEAVLSPDGEVIDGAVTRVEVWRMMTSGSHRLARQVSAAGVTWKAIKNSPWLAPGRRLSRDEAQVLELSARGVSPKEQAWALRVSRSSASRLFRSASAKLGVPAAHDAVRLVSGLLRPGVREACSSRRPRERCCDW